ncbi:MAG TPA: CoA transferase [Ramlibacter sp.]|uniref:CaiB/BaiF CoA transferase family protein n=1 Tax=Ramlibacter sp. TaxID=1917967 RepID=UPI002D1873E6|nr:CoA transferase [Ramlibacter sp.]HVZ43580.1 CoA transferase [Ramlibacter sp.]
MIRGALDGIRVLDLGQGIAAPFAARILGDFGADVIKVEPPEGDPARNLQPALLFEYLNWNKRGVTLDQVDVEALVKASDIVIDSGALGVAPKRMLEWNPRVVVCSVTDFGCEGPYAHFRGSDLVLQAMGGIMQISGASDRAPLKHGLNQAYFCGGLNAAYAALAAWTAAERDGIGDHVDLSIQECLVSELVTCETYYTFMGAIQGRRTAVQDPYLGAPIATKKGYLSFQASLAVPNETFAEIFRDERLRETRFTSNRERSQHLEEAREIIADAVKDREAKEIFLEGQSKRALMGVVQTAPDLLACEQLAARGFWVELGGVTYPGELVKMSATPTSVRSAAPKLGEHNATHHRHSRAGGNPEALQRAPDAKPLDPRVRGDDGELRNADDIRAGDEGARLPLEGLRVLDMATVIAVPYMAGLLSDLGAEVIKIESPLKLDPTRQGVLTTYLDNDTRVDAINRSGMFNVVNRGKRSMALDMGTDEGKQVFRELAAKADIIVNNFTPRVMANWGFGEDDLRKINPKLITLSNTGYGSTGPWRNFPSQGTTLEVTMGISAYTGYRGDKPWKVGQSYPDFLACWAGLAALFAALRHVRRTGQGQFIDLGMYQVGAALIPEAILQYQHDGTQPERIGNEDALHVPSNVYPCAGHDRWVAITVETDAQWRTLAGWMANDGVTADPALASEAARRTRREEVDSLVANWVREQDGFALMHRLQSAGIACGPVMNNRDILLDEHLRSRGFHERVELPQPMGVRPIMGRPWKLANRKVRIRHPAPRYGEDGPAILRDVLGMDEARIAALVAAKVVCTEPSVKKPFDAMGLAQLQRQKAIHEVDPDYKRKLNIA